MRETAIMVLLCLAVMLLGLTASSALADPVDNETCIDCHDEAYSQSLAGTTHDLAVAGTQYDIMCVSCHTGASVHIEEPSTDNIGIPSKMSPVEVTNICTQCHSPHPEMGDVGFDPHFNKEIACTDCHTIHAGQQELRPDDPAILCSRCHVGVKEMFARRSNHPLSDGAVTCVSCHSFTGANEPTVGHGASANCYSCHPEQSGPFVYEHPVTISFSTEGESCTECHDPHGSGNERLLVQKGSAQCLECHGVPPLHRTKHSGLGTKFECVDCHSDIHGSNHNEDFLDPDLGNKLFPNCYQSGCHDDL
jgi:DmsE family decaheme c-type cytochrome